MGLLGDVERGAVVESVVMEIGVLQDQQVQGQQVIERDNAGRLADANVSDQPDGAFLAETMRGSAVVAPSTTPFLVPGLPVRDVRLALEAEGPAVGWGGAVVVTQELGDGRLVELELVPLVGSDPRREDVLEERNEFFGRRRREGWSMAVRDVSGGVAVLSGPLAELELAELLDLTLGLR